MQRPRVSRNLLTERMEYQLQRYKQFLAQPETTSKADR